MHSPRTLNGSRPHVGHLEVTPLSKFTRKRAEFLDPGRRIPVGGLTVLFGDPKLGKSQWTCLLVAELSRGGLGEPAASLMISGEDAIEFAILPRLEAVGANLDLVHIVRGRDGGFQLPDDAAELEAAIKNTSARCVTIDPVSAHLADSINSHRDTEVRSALRPLAEIAERNSCAIVLVMHMNKSDGSKALYRAGGSIAFTAAARSLLLLARDPDDPEGERGKRRALCHVASNGAVEAPTLIYEVQTVTLPARGESPEDDVPRLRRLGTSERGSRDLLTVPDGDEKDELDEAIDWLRDNLSSSAHPQLGADVKKAARAEQISLRTLRRAREKLGLRYLKHGFPARTYWALSGDQPPWSPLDGATDGHHWTNPHEDRDSGPLKEALSPSGDHLPGMGTTGDSELDREIAEFVNRGDIRVLP